jgi:hypothetical protein
MFCYASPDQSADRIEHLAAEGVAGATLRTWRKERRLVGNWRRGRTVAS